MLLELFPETKNLTFDNPFLLQNFGCFGLDENLYAFLRFRPQDLRLLIRDVCQMHENLIRRREGRWQEHRPHLGKICLVIVILFF
jgi:hypothetical protein